jgi:hypothetical protein
MRGGILGKMPINQHFSALQARNTPVFQSHRS